MKTDAELIQHQQEQLRDAATNLADLEERVGELEGRLEELMRIAEGLAVMALKPAPRDRQSWERVLALVERL
jgi:hypothetical protein